MHEESITNQYCMICRCFSFYPHIIQTNQGQQLKVEKYRLRKSREAKDSNGDDESEVNLDEITN